ncbi:MAG: winged helix-turn-helix transcriptional regulator [Acidimicrobiia bacterium]
MPARKTLEDLRCSVANTAELVGDQWTIVILRDAFLGVRRFDDFQKDLGIARNVLAERLNRLVDVGILTTRLYEERPPRHEYLLTEKGKDLLDVLVALRRWGDRWNAPEERFIRPLRHLECGEIMEGVMSCNHCGQPLDHRNVRVEPSKVAVLRA